MSSEPIASSSSISPSTRLDTSEPVGATQTVGPDASTSSQLARLFALVGQLQSANKAQLSTNARLASEVEGLRTTVEDQDRVIGELSRSSGGFWVWESEKGGGRGRGRWVHSLEKYRLPSSIIASHAEPPTSLDSLPVELLSNILALLSRSEQASMCSTSMRFLDLASKPLYKKVKVDMRGAILLLNARLSTPSPSSFERVHPFLRPTIVLLHARNYHAPPSTPLLIQSEDSVPLENLAISFRATKNPTHIYTVWSPVLRLFNPSTFNISSGNGKRLLPTISRITTSAITFLNSWSRLEALSCFGKGTLAFLEDDQVGDAGDEGRMAFLPDLERINPVHGIKISIDLVFADGSRRELPVDDEEALKRRLREPFEVGEEVVGVPVWFGARGGEFLMDR